MKELILGFVLAVILNCGIASADTHYVSPYGNDTYPYTSWEMAADSIQIGINAAESGDTVMVGAGTYYENITLTPSIALIGAGFDSCTIDGGTEVQIIVTVADSCIVEGFHIKGGMGYIESMGIVLNCMNTWVKNNKVTDCYEGVSAYSSYHLVENNILVDNMEGLSVPWPCRPTFKNNTISGGRYGHASKGIYSLFSECTIVSNVIYDHAVGIFPEAWDSSYIANNSIYNCSWEAIFLDEIATGVIIENNTAVKTDQQSGRQVILCNRSSPQLINNIVIGGDRGIRTYAGTPHLYYNDVWGSNTYYLAGGGGSIDTVIGNIHQDPMFVDSLDFHLQMHSPCIDAGHPDIKDPDSSRSDMGAFGGPLGQTYTYLDLPPKAPDSLRATSLNTVLILSWKPNTESDLSHYVVYKDTTAFFDPDSSNMVAEVPKDSSVFRDFDFVLGNTYYYKISAWDLTGHESPYSEELEVLATSVWWEDETQVMTRTYELQRNYPNPFNPQTTITYTLPEGLHHTNLQIYNIKGQLV
ncbi:MAG: right-handed parallel beta-helix repeat-containing protein, partial [Desulfobacteraceae bacterium]|nr:right-handed parallel beta-helix repeat-containing protein [Desulfobacteraceae bacterium]